MKIKYIVYLLERGLHQRTFDPIHMTLRYTILSLILTETISRVVSTSKGCLHKHQEMETADLDKHLRNGKHLQIKRDMLREHRGYFHHQHSLPSSN